jgi:signal transduction histidine kinase
MTIPPFKKYPLLTSLILTEVLVLVVILAAVYLTHVFSSKTKLDNAIHVYRERCRSLIDPKQEHLRTLYFFGMKEALAREIDEVSNECPWMRITFVRAKELQTVPVEPRGFVLPALASDNPLDLYLRVFLEDAALSVFQQPDSFLTATLVGFAIFFSGLIFVSGGYIYRFLYRPLLAVGHSLNELEEGRPPKIGKISAMGEMKTFILRIERMYQRTKELEKEAAMSEIAAQLAHDIRSPVTALNLALENNVEMDEKRRSLASAALVRVNEIANGFLRKKRDDSFSIDVSATKEKSIENLACLISKIIEQKRIEFRTRQGLNFEWTPTLQNYHLFAKINSTEFKRALSNLINNSVEAIKCSGRIEARLSAEQQRIVLEIKDTGKGIPSDVLPKLDRRGASFGKENGSGLGLYHARMATIQWNGTLEVTSTLGAGTQIKLILPWQPAPKWFASEINFEHAEQVLFVGQLSRKLWEKRIPVGADLKRITLSDYEEFISWSLTDQRREKTICCMDIPKHCEEFLELSDRNITIFLNSDDCQEMDARQICEGLTFVKVVPKRFAPFLPATDRRIVDSASENTLHYN